MQNWVKLIETETRSISPTPSTIETNQQSLQKKDNLSE